jgi:hypothetical protein
VGILAPEPWTARLQLRDSAGLAPDFPHFSLTPSGEALCCAFSCESTLPRGSEVVKDSRRASDQDSHRAPFFPGHLLGASASTTRWERARKRAICWLAAAEGDGRALFVFPTEAGTALVDRALVILARVVHEALIGKFSETERAALLRTLSQIGQ